MFRKLWILFFWIVASITLVMIKWKLFTKLFYVEDFTAKKVFQTAKQDTLTPTPYQFSTLHIDKAKTLIIQLDSKSVFRQEIILSFFCRSNSRLSSPLSSTHFSFPTMFAQTFSSLFLIWVASYSRYLIKIFGTTNYVRLPCFYREQSEDRTIAISGEA